MAPSQLLRLLGITHPIIQAGMARQYTSARLVAAVSESGALGILGCLDRPAHEVVAEIRAIRALTDNPFGVNFVLHRLDAHAFEAALAERVPRVLVLPRRPDRRRGSCPPSRRRHDSSGNDDGGSAPGGEGGYRRDCGSGTEAGAHCGPLPLSAFLPDVIRLISDRPVIAAGGIVDGRGLAASIAVGAAGVLMGTRFLATLEAPASPNHKRAILDAGPESTVASGRFDLLWEDTRWPGVRVRALKNRLAHFLATADDANFAASLEELRAAMAQAIDVDDPERRPLLAGMGASRIDAILPVNKVVEVMMAEAETSIAAL